jgi:hypothetical protein
MRLLGLGVEHAVSQGYLAFSHERGVMAFEGIDKKSRIISCISFMFCADHTKS